MDDFIHILSEPVLIVDNNNIVIAVNKATSDLLKKDKEECVGVHYLSLFMLVPRPSFMDKARQRNEIPDLFNIEDRFFEMEFFSNIETADKATKILYRLKDVTTLHQNQEMLEFIRNDAPLGLFKILMDDYFTTIYGSDRFYAIHGFTEEEYKIERLSRSVNYMPPDDVQVAKDALWGAYHSGQKSMAFEMRIIRRDGSHGWLLTQCSFVNTVDGVILYGFVTDNTVVKQQQEDLKQLEQVCAYTIDNDYLSIFLVDAQTEEYKQISGNNITRKEILSRGRYKDLVVTLLDMVSDSYKDDFGANITLSNIKCELLRNALYSFKVKYINDRHESRYLMVNTRYYDDQHNKLLLCFRDIDDEERKSEFLHLALESAKKANMSKSSFLSRMSHDIRTPMNTIVGMCNIASLYTDNPNRVKECLNNIEIASRFLLSLINDVLDMSKIESGKMDLRVEKFSFTDMMRSITGICYHSASEKNIDFNVSVSTDLDNEYKGDSLHLRQILMNLLSNALKFTSKDIGKVNLVVERLCRNDSMDIVRFQIEDNGIGMSKSFMDKMFVPFEQEVDNQYGLSGTGLGLSITSHLVELMNGTIAVESEPQKGSKFTVDIPLSIDLERREEHRFKRPVLNDVKKIQILVVDDDLITCKHTIQIFKELNIDADYTLYSSEAVRFVQRKSSEDSHYDIILVDWKMPEMDGIEVTRAIRKIVGEDVTIVVMSAYDWASIEQEARQAGVNYFISKPMFKEDIFDLMQKISFSAGEPSPRYANEPQEHRFNKEQILLVEDNDINREILKTLLEYENLSVISAINGADAVKQFKESAEHEIKAILMDVRMPVMDGLEATKVIRTLQRIDAAEVPIFALSANAFVEDVQKSLKCGMNEHLSKPVDIKEVINYLWKYINK